MARKKENMEITINEIGLGIYLITDEKTVKIDKNMKEMMIKSEPITNYGYDFKTNLVLRTLTVICESAVIGLVLGKTILEHIVSTGSNRCSARKFVICAVEHFWVLRFGRLKVKKMGFFWDLIVFSNHTYSAAIQRNTVGCNR